jgi:polyhydroxybutyrate depolymerase
MSAIALHLLAALAIAGQPLGPGDHERSVKVDGTTRSYLVHVPPHYDPKKPTPVVLNFHGALTNGGLQVHLSGLSNKADQCNFVVVYPNGTGANSVLFWNSGDYWPKSWPKPTEKPADDVRFVAKLLDDLGAVVKVDKKRVYATGLSNGAEMCYRLAAELSDRIAAIAPVGGVMGISKASPKRPVPVMHFHGTADTFVSFNNVDGTIKTWVKLNGCTGKPKIVKLPDKAHDGTKVTKTVYGGGRKGAEVILFTIEGGGHTWPGRVPLVEFVMGKSTKQISANDLIWEFFQKHPLK